MEKIYVIQVLTGYEEMVMDQIIRYEHPKIKKIYNPKNALGAPVFPGYLFLEMILDGDTYRLVLDTPWVVQYLCPTSGVRPIASKEAEKIKNHVEAFISPGQLVKIGSGPYKGIEGIVESLRFPTIRIETVVFGEKTFVNVHVKHLDITGIMLGLNSKKIVQV